MAYRPNSSSKCRSVCGSISDYVFDLVMLVLQLPVNFLHVLVCGKKKSDVKGLTIDNLIANCFVDFVYR